MMKRLVMLSLCWILAAGLPAWAQEAGGDKVKAEAALRVKLPEPKRDGLVSVEKAIQNRRSVRGYSGDPLSLAEVSQILWAAYGITEARPDGPAFIRGGLRAAPSAGALYPLEIYLVAGNVTGLAAGIYRYVSEEHALARVQEGDGREALCQAALGQPWIREAPAALVVAAVFARTTKKYGERGSTRYVWMDAGFAGENVYLQAQALGLGCCIAGAFNDEAVKQAMSMPTGEEPVCILAVGKRK